MKLCDIIPEGGILESIQAQTKPEVIKEMVQALVKAGKVEAACFDKAIKALMDREDLGSTGIGSGVAVPHVRNDSINDIVAAVGRSSKGIDFEALDGEPVHIFFLLLSSRAAAASHLEVLAYIARLVRDEKFVKLIREAGNSTDIRRVLSEADSALGGM